MSKKLYLQILQIGSYLSLISIFLFYSGFLFPFITTKQIYFNILIEILTIFWISFILKYPDSNPFRNLKSKKKANFITLSLLAYCAVLVLSCFFSVDFNLSFWGDIERMLGVFHVLHFLVFYLILITAFREWKDWRKLFVFSIIFASFVAVKGLSGKKYSTLGNNAYLSAYLIFNIYFCLFLFFKDKVNQLKWLYLLPIPLMLASLKNADTSGAVVGMAFSIVLIFFLWGILAKNKKIKRISWSIFLLLFFTGLLVFVYKDSEVVKSVKMIKDISFQKNTFQTRLISWKTAWYDLGNHPMLGTGYGNFSVTFDKFFDPKFYNYTDSETYFDRAHNNLVEVASTTGIFGLITYLTIFLAVVCYLFKGVRENRIELHDFVLVLGLISAYFIQNLAVFDALATYLCLMITLAYVYWIYEDKNENIFDKEGNKVKEIKEKTIYNEGKKNMEFYILLISSIVLLTITYQFNVRPIMMLRGTIKGQIFLSQNRLVEAYETYKETLSLETVLDRDSRTSFFRTLPSKYEALKKLDKHKAREILDYAVSLAKKNIEYNKQDSLHQMYLANILDLTSKFYTDNPEKFYYYSGQALEAIDDSINASPGRIPVYFSKAQILLGRGEKEKIIETIKYARDLNKDYNAGYCKLGQFYMALGQKEEGIKELTACVDRNGSEFIRSRGIPVKDLVVRFKENNDNNRLIKLYEGLSGLNKNNVDFWIDLAAIYREQGMREKAIEAAQKVGELDASLRASVEKFIKELE